MTPVIFIFPVLAIPNVKPLVLVIPPVLIVNAFVAASLFILDAEATVISPDIVAALEPLIILIAPFCVPDSENPNPFILIASGIVMAPLISKAAPSITVVVEAPVPAVMLPNALALVTCNTPALIVVNPV